MDHKLEEYLAKSFPLFYPDGYAHCDCSDGWFYIIWNASWELEEFNKTILASEDDDSLCSFCTEPRYKHANSLIACDKYRISYATMAQIKEKFGSLRFYIDCTWDQAQKIATKYERLSIGICEHCGSTEAKITNTGHWLHSLCKLCLPKK